ncbi:MAG: class I SAM-dependent methyltransferase [Rhodocyclaceae bacterium]|nr:class I SAM-dependent methyltransferase [Rhodocyclaceae bacterium]
MLRDHFADRRTVLEIGSGTGQHAVYFVSAALPHLTWQASDRADNPAASTPGSGRDGPRPTRPPRSRSIERRLAAPALDAVSARTRCTSWVGPRSSACLPACRTSSPAMRGWPFTAPSIHGGKFTSE